MSVTIYFWLDEAGLDLTLELYLRDQPDGISNTAGGDPVTQPDPDGVPFYYECEVSVDDGDYEAVIKEDGLYVSGGYVSVVDGLRCEIDNPVQAVVSGTASIENQQQIINLVNTLPVQLSGSRVITVVLPTLSGNKLNGPLRVGDSYLSANGRAIEFSSADWPDLDNIQENSLKLHAKQRVNSVPSRFTITGTVVVSTGTKVIRFEPDSEATLEYVPGEYEFEVEVTFDDADNNKATLVGGVTLQVLPGVTGE